MALRRLRTPRLRLRPDLPDVPDLPRMDALDQLDALSDDAPAGTRTWPVVVTTVVVLFEAVVLGLAARSTGSAVLFAEAAQSLAGVGVEAFLLVGARRARRPPDDLHPMGHGREAFFWSLLAALGVFVGGGVVSISYGLQSWSDGNAGHESFPLGYVLLAVVVLVDAGTLWVAVRPVRTSAAARRVGFWRGLRRTSDASARTLVFDNATAVLGGLVGIAGLAVHQVTGDARADAAASLAIGVLLLATTVLLLQANRELLTDRAIAPEIVEAMRGRVRAQHGVVAVPDLVAVYTGPHAVLVTGTVGLDVDLDVHAVERALADAGQALTDRWPGELRVYLAPVAATAGQSCPVAQPAD